MLAAGLDGIDRGLVPPKPLNNVNVYELTPEERTKHHIAELPGSLREAITEMEKDKLVKEALGSEIYEAFTRAKWAEWDEYRTTVTDWELEKYLETA
jgi:glutamine synthetase